MLKKLQKSDLIFIIVMLGGLLLHLSCIYSANHFADEAFHPTIPLRLIYGDSLISDEWHLTQFSSLFLYIPVRLGLLINGSTEGLILFLRYFYLAIHTTTSVVIYAFFRKNKIWAVAATLFFYTQVPLRFLGANHHSLLALFLLLMTITFVMLYEKENTFLYLFAGFCFGCCCVNNPFFCLLYTPYVVICIIWHIKKKHYRKNSRNLSYEEAFAITQKSKIGNRFFGKRAFLKFNAGLFIAVVVSVLFFLGTGGKFDEVLRNIPYLLEDGGHDIFATPLASFIEKVTLTIQHFNTISLNLPFLLPLFYITLLIDKKRKSPSHKLCYIILSFLLAIFYTISITISAVQNSRCLAISLPFATLSITCYILTENKNKKLFYCMWLPGLLANVVQYLASDLHLSTMWVMIISNIAGIFFVKDFIQEIKSEEFEKKNIQKTCQILLCIGICLQLVFQCCIYLIGRTVNVKESIVLERGPYAGLLLDKESCDRNNSMMDDLDIIKSRTSPDDPVLIISEFSWMYLYIDRPFGTYSAWQPFVESARLRSYYRENPERTPKYVYIGNVFIPSSVIGGYKINNVRAENFAKEIMQIFDCECENLSNGILLTVKDFDSRN